jgi:large subunit ribosomal protein L8e
MRHVAQYRGGRVSVSENPSSHRSFAPRGLCFWRASLRVMLRYRAGAPLAEVSFRSRYKFGTEKAVFLAAEGMYSGQFVYAGVKAQIAVGNVLPIAKIPEGSVVSNVELYPGDRGSLGRASGTYCIVVTHNEDTGRTQIRLPSGMKKTVDNRVRAMVGLVAGGGRMDKPLLKAGAAYHKYRVKRNEWPKVRGVAMNPVEHPHGGGNHQHIGHASTCRRDAPPGSKARSLFAALVVFFVVAAAGPGCCFEKCCSACFRVALPRLTRTCARKWAPAQRATHTGSLTHGCFCACSVASLLLSWRGPRTCARRSVSLRPAALVSSAVAPRSSRARTTSKPPRACPHRAPLCGDRVRRRHKTKTPAVPRSVPRFEVPREGLRAKQQQQ